MKKTEKVFNEINNGLGFIQNLNEKRNEEHKEPFLFLYAQRDEDNELPFLNIICSADDEILEEIVLKVLEKEPEIRKVILKALKKCREKQLLKAIEAASEGFKKIADMFNRPIPPKYPLGGVMAGKPHDEAKRIFQSSGKLKGDEDYSESKHPMLDYWNGQKIFFFENCCSNEIVLIENYDALRYALTKELIIYKLNLL